MSSYIQKTLAVALLSLVTLSFAPSKDKFTAAEQQQISIATPGLFARSGAFSVDFSSLRADEYSFPLPVGKASLTADGSMLEIATKKGDAVKAMFNGTVRLSRNMPQYGNVIVVRHPNGLETMYANNAQNLVKVGDEVKAGQTIAIVGGKERKVFCTFAIMVNGGRINPRTIVDYRSHHLIAQTLLFKRQGSHVNVSHLDSEKSSKHGITSLDPDDEDKELLKNATFELDMEALEKEHWSYPLPGSHVISPYGGRRHHGGVDIKTKPNDNILAAFDGVVTRSKPYYGYGNCIVLKHAYGFETLYSHQSKNLVKVGQKVKAGQVIGLTGRTGRATTEHLHFEVHFKGHRLNPAILFDHTNKKLQAATLTLGKNGSVRSKKH